MSMKQYNTFALPSKARQIVICETVDQVTKAWQDAQTLKEPFLILGEGSNVLFIEDFCGTVVINRIKGVEVKEEIDFWFLHVGAGQNWHSLVERTLEHNMPGLENLALIPGCVGTAPIQNIGAYGMEFKDVCDYVDVLNLKDGVIDRISKEKCEFGYRESVFKHTLKTGFVIVAVGLQLSKIWKPILNYGNLSTLDPETATPYDVFESVCAMRRSKLPDPKITGNAGSFFKNPLINMEQAKELLEKYPNLPHYPQEKGVKLAAGWLIEQCRLKGFRIGDAAVHDRQALVLVNLGMASGEDIISLARHVRKSVADRFGVTLEPEVRLIGATGEVDAVMYLATKKNWGF